MTFQFDPWNGQFYDRSMVARIADPLDPHRPLHDAWGANCARWVQQDPNRCRHDHQYQLYCARSCYLLVPADGAETQDRSPLPTADADADADADAGEPVDVKFTNPSALPVQLLVFDHGRLQPHATIQPGGALTVQTRLA